MSHEHLGAMTLWRLDEEPELRKRRRLFTMNPSLVRDEAVVQRMIALDYRAYRRKEPKIRKLINRVAVIASEIAEGFPIEFRGIGEDERGLFPEFKTPDGVLPLDRLSQGTQSMIQWIAHLSIGYAEYYAFPKDLAGKPGILIIDEIDAHLHPSWQQRKVPTLCRHFPRLQMFFSTDPPLMLAGLKAGQIHLLHRDARGKVSISTNQNDILGWSADEILRGVMRIGSPTGLATAENIRRRH